VPVPASPSSAAQQARARIAAVLHEQRLDAGLTVRALALACGWSAAKASRIENGRTQPSDSDLVAWCTAAGQPERARDLTAANRQAGQLYVEWRRRQRTGLRRIQEAALEEIEQSSLQRVYSSSVIPGFFQTAGYCRALFTAFVNFEDIPDDVDQAVAARLERGRLLRDGGRRFVVLLEETVLHYRVGAPAVMREQLRHLLRVQRLPTVALGIVPFTADRSGIWPMESFYLYDQSRALVETLSAEVNVVAPAELALYDRAFAELGRLAVYGPTAAARINTALLALDD